MSRLNRLHSTSTGTITGASDVITFYHGLRQSGLPVVPSTASLSFTSSQQNSGPAQAVCGVLYQFGGFVPAAADTLEVGAETWTWAASRTLPFTVARVAGSVAGCLANLVAAFNADTAQNLVMDTSGVDARVRGAVAPGGAVDFGSRVGALSVNTNVGTVTGWNFANLNLGGGAGEVCGSPSYSILVQDSTMVKYRVRGMRTTDSLTFNAEAHFEAWATTPVETKVSGVNGATTLGLLTFTSAAAGFIAAGVEEGDYLVIYDATDLGCNGRYPIRTVDSATQLTLYASQDGVSYLPLGMKATLANLTYRVGPACLVGDQDPGISQPAYDLPSTDSHSAASPATDVALPAASIDLAELDLSVQQDLGSVGVGHVRFTADPAAGQTVTFNGTEIWTAADPIVLARDFLRGGGAPATLASLISRVNADATSTVRLVNLTGDVAAVYVKPLASGVYANEALSRVGASIEVSAANTVGARPAADITKAAGFFTANAEHVAALLAGAEIAVMAVPGTTQPQTLSFNLRTAAGVYKSPATVGAVWRQEAGANQWVLAVADGGAVIANTDVLSVEAVIQ